MKKKEEPKIVRQSDKKQAKIEFCTNHLGGKKYQEMYRVMKDMKDS